MRKLLFVVFVVFVVGSYSHITAQQNLTLSGTVSDSTEKATKIVLVSLSLDSNLVQQIFTDDSGKFQFNNLDTGKHILKCNSFNYAPKTVEFNLHNDSSIRIELLQKTNQTKKTLIVKPSVVKYSGPHCGFRIWNDPLFKIARHSDLATLNSFVQFLVAGTQMTQTSISDSGIGNTINTPIDYFDGGGIMQGAAILD